MRKAVLLVLLLSALPALARERWLGRLTSTGTSVNNTTTAVPFTFASGIPLAIQCDSGASVRAGVGSSSAVSESAGATKGTRVSTDQLFDLGRSGQKAADGTAYDTIAVISISGTVNCDVFEVTL